MKELKDFRRILIAGALLLAFALPTTAGDRKKLINKDWRFALLIDSVAPAAVDFNDNGWRRLSLPHDWSVEYPFDKNNASGNDGAYLPTGAGWYRHTLNVNPESIGKKLQLYFEGAYMKSYIYVNGKLAGINPYGYSSFFVDITPFVKIGDNTIAVRVDNSMQKNCRWYSGSGIYRNVWLTETDKTHIDNWGVRIFTPNLNTALVKATLVNESDMPKNLSITTDIDGNTASDDCVLNPGERITIAQTIKVPDAKSWSTDAPNLYYANVTVTENGKTIDRISERFGFKTVEWSAIHGLRINGKPTILNGGCAHHDNGILGAAAHDAAEYYRASLLKNAGFNAVRTSHNIPSETFLNACDEIGLLVIDEAFDGWRDAKNTHDYHELFDKNWQKDLDAMLMRDINHPSVFCWSVGNEVIERDKIEVVTTARQLVDRCHDLDPYRPVTSALANWGKDWKTYDPLAEAFDIPGYNYMIHESERDHRRDPNRVMLQTESFPKDAWSNYRKVIDNPYIIGDFVWTAIDYLGESGIGRWYYEGELPGEHFERPLYPWHASYCGDIDLTGLRKPISHYRSMLWNKDGEQLYMAVKEPDGYNGKVKTTMWGTWPTFESWNWPGHEGKDIDVEVYSHYPKVRLYLNDSLIGEENVSEMKAVFTLPYREGTLRAEGIADNKSGESVTLKTAGKPAAIRLTADRKELRADGRDMAFVVIEIIDTEGNVVPIADNDLIVAVSGGASLKALGNADIKDEDCYTDSTHKAWKGRALAAIQSSGKKGNAYIKVSSPLLKSQSMKLSIK